MSAGPDQINLDFRYDDPNTTSGPPFYTVICCGVHYIVPNDNIAVPVATGPVPPVDNGILKIIVHKNYHPITLYFDGESVWFPQADRDGNPYASVLFEGGASVFFNIFPTDPTAHAGQVHITNMGSDTGSEIGLVIVGTSGLGDKEP